MYIPNINKFGKWENSSKTKTYNSWASMRSRCYRKKDKCYNLYGGRGIKICDRWLNNYDNFFEDMGERPIGMCLDRIDPNGDYEKDNCRWATMKDQQLNRRNNFIVEFNNQKLSISQWSLRTGLNPDTIWNRLIRWNWTVEKALTYTTSRPWNHGTNTGYSKYKCRCDKCKESNKLKSKKARIKQKLLKMDYK